MERMRTTLTAAQLYLILDHDFQARKPRQCQRCRAPIPYLRKPPDEVSANWNVGTPPECPNRCHLVLAELLATLWTKYDLQPERAH